MKTYLITGATGYLGSRITIDLIEKGHSVIILKRKSSSMHRLKGVTDSLVAFDLETTDLASMFQKVSKIDAVLHCATCYGRNNEELMSIVEVNTLLPLQLLELANKNNVKCFFNIDTALVSGVSAYALSKKQFLDWARFLTKNNTTRFVNIISEYFYGPGDNENSFISYIIKSCLSNVHELKLTSGEQQRDFIYIDDAISLVGLILDDLDMERSKYSEFEVGTGEPISIKDVVQLVHHLTSSNTKLKFGAIPYRDNEVMLSKANLQSVASLGWNCEYTIEKGLVATIDSIIEAEE